MQKLSVILLGMLFSGVSFSGFAFAQEGPIAEDDFYTIDEDSHLIVDSIGVLQNDTNFSNDPLNAVLKTDVNFGTLKFHQNGNFTYLPNENSIINDSFTYVANNGTHNSNDATVIIFVNPINDAPVAQNDYVETQQNVAIAIDVLQNDSDVDNDSLNIFLEIDPSETRGFLEIQESQILFTPIVGFVGDTTFSYLVYDGELKSNYANVTISVIENDEEPDDSIFEQIFERIQSIFDKVITLENEVSQLREKNSLLEERISALEAFHRNETLGNNEKVVICHNGKNTITVSQNALSAHLNHGDTKGKCLDVQHSTSFSTLAMSNIQSNFSNERVDVCHNEKVTLSLPGKAARHHLEHHDDDYLGQCTENSTLQEAEKLAKQQADQKQREAKKDAQEAEKLAKQQADQKQREAEKSQKEKEKLSKIESKEKELKSK